MALKALLFFIAAVLLLFFPVYILQVTGMVLLFVLVLSWLLSIIPRRYIRVHVELEIVRCFLHEKNEIRLIIYNESFIPIPLLALRDNTGGLTLDGSNVAMHFLPARGQAIFSYNVWSTQRGLYNLGPLSLNASDPLGLFPWEQKFEKLRLVFIYPRIAPLDFQTKHGIAGGPINSHHPMFQDTTQIRSIRPYQSGDDPRHIHWPATAHVGNLQTSEFGRNLTLPFYIILNLCDADFHNKRKAYHQERCIEAAAAFIDEAGKRNFALGFITNGVVPKEARKYILDIEEEIPVLHTGIRPALEIASLLMTQLSVMTAGTATLRDMLEHLELRLSPRIIVISPPMNPVDFEAWSMAIPRTCKLDFWFLDEHVQNGERVDHRSPPPLAGIRLRKLPEYGDELLNPEENHG